MHTACNCYCGIEIVSIRLTFCADEVYVRSDVYNPSLNIWRRAADMSDPRHGIFPVLAPVNNLMYLFGGGEHSAAAQTQTATEFLGP